MDFLRVHHCCHSEFIKFAILPVSAAGRFISGITIPGPAHGPPGSRYIILEDEQKETGREVNMDENGIIPARMKERITLRLRSLEPFSPELTSAQIGVIADVAERYGAGVVHVTPRQCVEIPDVETAYREDALRLLSSYSLYPGSSGRYMRNVIACSRWCLYNVTLVSDLAKRLNNLFAEAVLPGKTTISLSGCGFSCVRSKTSDIGVIARAEIELTDIKCKRCSLCVKAPLGCQVDAITLTEDGLVIIDTERCVRCGLCTNVCRPRTITVKSRGFDLFIGGKGGIKPKEAIFYKTVSSEDELIRELGRVLDRYGDMARDGERIADLLEREGREILEV